MRELTVTKEAYNKITEINGEKFQYLMLHYDTDDCGCGVNGLPTIRLTNKIDQTYESVFCEEFQVLIHYQQQTFFANKMTLDYVNNGFRLSSPEGILNPIIAEQELLKGDVA